MNPIVFYFANGTTFFVGLAIVLVSEVLLIRFQKRFARSALTLLVLLGMILIVLSATPISIFLYLVWGISAGIGYFLIRRNQVTRSTKQIACGFLAATTSLLCVLEVQYHLLETVLVPQGTTIYVLGDSISAGINGKQKCWPEVLNDSTNFQVVNLAQAGAKVSQAINQAKEIPESKSLVIVEIGGNDLLGGTDAIAFQSKFETLIKTLANQNHQILIFEMPLFPFQNSFGYAQRSTARRYNAAILPKRYFTKVLAMQNGTCKQRPENVAPSGEW
ncbi:MAG: hypothetical protein JKY95_11795 [Planctomycetaceae bacterium]|nr:hypothetical protein [Planctomycetaceae bacterium]